MSKTETGSRFSDRATSPTDMLPVFPPEGTIKCDATKENFGVKSMLYGLVNTYDDSEVPFIEGTFITFTPGPINAHVARRKLTAEEINRIGQLCLFIDNASESKQYLSEVDAKITEARESLSASNVPYQSEVPVNFGRVFVAKKLLAVQEAIQEIREREQINKVVLQEAQNEAHELGVRFISSNTSGQIKGTPIRKVSAQELSLV